MHRFVIALLSAGALASVVTALDDPPKGKAEAATAKTPQEQYEAIAEEFDKAQNEFRKLYRAAKPEERRKLVEEKAPKPEEFAKRFLELAQKHPKTDAASESLVWVVTRLGGGPAAKEAIGLLGKDYVTSEKIGDACEAIAGVGDPTSQALLTRILAENQNKDARGKACFALAQFFLQQSQFAEQLEGENAKQLEDYLGKERVEAIKAGKKEFPKQAEHYLESVIKNFADVKSYRGTLGESAKGELFEIQNLAVGKVAPEIESKDLDDKPVKLSDLRGKVVVLDIWATWCGPCVGMIPHERELVEKLKDQPFAFVSISFDDKAETVKKFMDKEPMPWIHWFNGPEGPLGKAWNIKYFPTIYVLDKKGVIRYKGVRGEAMDKAVEALLAEKS